MQSSCLQRLLSDEPQLKSTLKKNKEKIALTINIQNVLVFIQTHLIKQEDTDFLKTGRNVNLCCMHMHEYV